MYMSSAFKFVFFLLAELTRAFLKVLLGDQFVICVSVSVLVCLLVFPGVDLKKSRLAATNIVFTHSRRVYLIIVHLYMYIEIYIYMRVYIRENKTFILL